MHFPAFLPPLLIIRSITHRSQLFHRFSTSRHLKPYCATPITPSTDLRHSAQFLRHQWRTAIIRTAPHFPTPIAIDATAGRGSDTITLGEYLGPTGIIHAFDIQHLAIEETHARYKQFSETHQMANLQLHNISHADFSILGLPQASVSVVAYNLGWCPSRNADRSLVTIIDTTVSSLASAHSLLAVGGLISVMAYVGHPGGKEEQQAVIDWSASLCKKRWSVVLVTYPNRASAPTLLLCQRIS